MLLQRYFYLDEVKSALDDIGEPTSGSKSQLISRLIRTWESHNRGVYGLLDYLDVQTLRILCKDYGLDYRGDRAALLQTIRQADLLIVPNGGSPGIETRPSPEQSSPPVAAGVSDIRRLRFRWPLWVSIALTVAVYFILPLLGLTEILQIAAAAVCFIGLWSSLRYLSERT